MLAKEFTPREKKAVKDPFKDAKEYGPYFAFGAFCLLLVSMAL